MNSNIDSANSKSQDSKSLSSSKTQLNKNKRKKRTYKVNRRKGQLEKAWKDMNPDERSNFIWNQKLDSCLKSNIGYIIKDEPKILEIDSTLQEVYSIFKTEKSLESSQKLKESLTKLVDKITLNSKTSTEENNQKSLPCIFTYIDIDEKVEFIEYEIKIIDKIIRRLTDKVNMNKNYNNSDVICKSMKISEIEEEIVKIDSKKDNKKDKSCTFLNQILKKDKSNLDSQKTKKRIMKII